MKVLITGGTGFVGSHLCDMLINEGHEIVVLARNDNKIENVKNIIKQIQIKYIDVTNFDELGYSIESIKPDTIFHLAGETSHKKSFENPLYDVDVNSKSTLYILEKIKNLNLNCKFILGSTFIVIGKPLQLPINEDTSCNPTTIYGADRLASEHYCKIYNNLYNLDTIIFRITNSFGPREQYKTPTKNALNFLIYQAFQGNEVNIYNEGKFFRDVIYISDVISALTTIMHKGKSGNLYWIASGKKTWFYEIGKWLKQLTNTQVKYIDTPEYAKKTDVGNFLVDNSKLKSLGWKPTISVKDGIQKTLENFESLTV